MKAMLDLFISRHPFSGTHTSYIKCIWPGLNHFYGHPILDTVNSCLYNNVSLIAEWQVKVHLSFYFCNTTKKWLMSCQLQYSMKWKIRLEGWNVEKKTHKASTPFWALSINAALCTKDLRNSCNGDSDVCIWISLLYSLLSSPQMSETTS